MISPFERCIVCLPREREDVGDRGRGSLWKSFLGWSKGPGVFASGCASGTKLLCQAAERAGARKLTVVCVGWAISASPQTNGDHDGQPQKSRRRVGILQPLSARRGPDRARRGWGGGDAGAGGSDLRPFGRRGLRRPQRLSSGPARQSGQRRRADAGDLLLSRGEAGKPVARFECREPRVRSLRRNGASRRKVSPAGDKSRRFPAFAVHSARKITKNAATLWLAAPQLHDIVNAASQGPSQRVDVMSYHCVGL